MKTYKVHLKSTSPYSQAKAINELRPATETHEEFEKRNLRRRIHADQDGIVFIPPQSIKSAMCDIIGDDKGITVGRLSLGIKADDVQGEWLCVPESGRRGDMKRVNKCFPVIPEWEGTVDVYVINEEFTKSDIYTAIQAAGKAIGIGRHRPAKNGYYGCFEVVSIEEQL